MDLFLKSNLLQSLSIFFWGVFSFLLICPLQAFSQAHSHFGVQPLLHIHESSIADLIPQTAQPLIQVKDIEAFLNKLENAPPDWTQLRHSDITQQSEQLFQFNRKRDKARSANVILGKPVAFLWSGVLRQYLPEYQGFSLAIGPEHTQTSWGIIRFKPIDLPDYLVTIPSPGLRQKLRTRQKEGEHIEIGILCIGKLVSEESLIYGFSHEGHQEGMILPVVSVQNIRYFLKSP